MAVGTIPYNGSSAETWEGTPGEGARPDSIQWPQSFAMPSVYGGDGASDPHKSAGTFTTRTITAISSLLPPKMENMNG